MKQSFQNSSYEKHEDHWSLYTSTSENSEHAKTWLKEDTIDYWRHERMLNCIKPIIEAYPRSTWKYRKN